MTYFGEDNRSYGKDDVFLVMIIKNTVWLPQSMYVGLHRMPNGGNLLITYICTYPVEARYYFSSSLTKLHHPCHNLAIID